MDRSVTSPLSHLGLPQPPKFPSNPKKRPRPPLPFDQDDEEDGRKDSPNAVAHPPRPQHALSNPQFTNSQINHLQRERLRRLMARRAAPPRRACSSLASNIPSQTPSPVLSAKPAVKPVAKPHPDQARGNGRVHPPAAPQSSPSASLWNRLGHAQAALNAQPRTDPRFVSARRPLDCISGLRVSIALTLFADGYARHDANNGVPNRVAANAVMANGEASPGHDNATLNKAGATPPSKLINATVSAKNVNIATLPRYPYDRASRDFLRALDLGVIPPPEDLPEPSQCHYYDGCLIAEVTDLRDIRPGAVVKYRPEARKKILLRPDMSSVYSDVASMTRHVDSTVAMLVEQKIIAAIAGPVDCDPTPKLACSLQQGNVHINTTAINIARRPKRRRVHRPPGGPALPSLSTPALLLIGAAEKHQTSLLNALMGASVAEDSSSHSTAVTMNTASLSAAINSGKVSGDGSVNSDVRTATGKNGAATMSKPAAVQKRRLLKPPKSLLQLHREKNETNVRSLANRSGQPNIPPRQEHLRVVRLVLPDQNGKVTLQRLSNAEATMPRENAERIQIAKQQALTAIAKNGGQMYVLEFIKYPSRGFEIMISRFVYGDRNRDAFRVRVGSEEEGHQFLNQFKVLAGKEGFHVMQDLKWSQHLRQKQQQHQQQQQQQQQHARALQQRQNAITAGRQPAVSQTQSNAQNAALQSKRAQARALSKSNPPANARQILLQKQKQPDVREQHRLQRERQKAAQSGHQNLAALRQGATHTHMPLQGQPMGAQSQLSQQHQRSHMALQQQQQQLFQQHVQLQRQEPQRARRSQTQLPGRDKMNISMAQPVALSASNARGGLVSQGPGAIQGNLGLPQAGGPSSSIAGMGSAGLMGHQVLTQSQMRQFQQNLRNQNLRNQQPLLAEHQRNLMAAAGGRDAVTGMAGNTGIAANAAMAQHLPTHVLANFMSAGMASGAARPGAAPNLTAAETLTRQRQRMQQQQHLKQQRENVEPHARSAKR